jgi:cytidylate kinase
MAVITVSREYGSRGEEITQEAAKELGYSYFDKDILADVARIANTTEDEIRQYDEKDEHGLHTFLKKLFIAQPLVVAEFPYYYPPTMPLDWSIGPIENEKRLDPESVTAFFHQVVEELWRRDDVVIVGRASQKILASKPHTLHVRFVGTMQDRCKQVMAADSLTHVEAAKKIMAIDKGRAHYLKRHHDADWTDSTLYHLVINSSLIPIDQAVKIIKLSLRDMEN